jgi:hypothetical protein
MLQNSLVSALVQGGGKALGEIRAKLSRVSWSPPRKEK